MSRQTTGDHPVVLGRSYTPEQVGEMAWDPPSGVEVPGPPALHRYRAASTWIAIRGERKALALAPAGVWIATGTRTADPYPCRCDNPDWCPGARGRCPCWAQPLHAGVPSGCCRHRPASRKLADWTPDHLNAPEPPPVRSPGATPELRRDSDDGGLVEHLPAMVAADGLADLPAAEMSQAELAAAAKARIKAGRWQCTTCPSPWPGGKRTSGYHCPECHTNWSSYGLSGMHIRGGTCIKPSLIKDVDYGHPLVRVTRVNGCDVWCQAPLSSPRRPGFKYE